MNSTRSDPSFSVKSNLGSERSVSLLTNIHTTKSELGLVYPFHSETARFHKHTETGIFFSHPTVLYCRKWLEQITPFLTTCSRPFVHRKFLSLLIRFPLKPGFIDFSLFSFLFRFIRRKKVRE